MREMTPAQFAEWKANKTSFGNSRTGNSRETKNRLKAKQKSRKDKHNLESTAPKAGENAAVSERK